MYALTPSVHTPPFWQGFAAQSSMFVSHAAPLKPAAHVQAKPLTRSVHAPPFWQGFGAHSSTSISQFAPLQPGAHAQR